jgi:mRNA interferase RelE/StbE
MKWTINFDKYAFKSLSKIDKNAQTKILNFLKVDLLSLESPRQKGKALQGKFKGLWRYRVGDYRIICNIIDNELVIIAVEIDHRSRVYKN